MNETEETTRPRPVAVPRSKLHDSRSFSLAELMVALGVTLMIMAVSARMLSMTLSVRARENQRTEAISDVERVRIVASVMLPALGSAGQAGYQPATRMRVQSEVTLRNRMLAK